MSIIKNLFLVKTCSRCISLKLHFFNSYHSLFQEEKQFIYSIKSFFTKSKPKFKLKIDYNIEEEKNGTSKFSLLFPNATVVILTLHYL